MRTLSIATIVVALLFVGCSTLFAHDEADVLYIGRLDPDDYPDTITGIATGDLRMLPVAIYWGMPIDASMRRTGASMLHHRLRTELRYPFGDSTVGNFALQDVSADGVDDVVLFYESSSVASSDSMRVIAIVGQRALHDVALIDLSTIPHGIQWHPFIAIDLTSVDLFRDGATRELSGTPSYSWETLPIAVRDTIGAGLPSPTITDWMMLFPNPATTMATFESGRLAPGQYVVEVIDLNGTVRQARNIVVESEQPLSGTVDLSAQAVGLYVVRIRSGDRTVATYPIVVVR